MIKNNKRFSFDSEVGFIDLEKCGGDTISNNEIVDLLNELYDENQKSKELFLLILKKLGRTNIQCDFCKFGEFYEYYENHGKDITHEFICHKNHGNYAHTISLCPDWEIEVKE